MMRRKTLTEKLLKLTTLEVLLKFNLFYNTKKKKDEEDLDKVTLKSGFVWKRGGGKKSSAWKLRWFVITKSQRMYYFKGPEVKNKKRSVH
jgi:hypothetical protein